MNFLFKMMDFVFETMQTAKRALINGEGSIPYTNEDSLLKVGDFRLKNEEISLQIDDFCVSKGEDRWFLQVDALTKVISKKTSLDEIKSVLNIHRNEDHQSLSKTNLATKSVLNIHRNEDLVRLRFRYNDDFVLKMMHFVLKMMIFVLKMMIFVLKMT